MISDVKTVLDAVSALLEKRKVSAKEKTRDRVLIAIYQLGDDGSESVDADRLEQAGFTKLEVIDSIMAAKDRNWIIDATSFEGMSWALKQEALYYVEGLLEASGVASRKKA